MTSSFTTGKLYLEEPASGDYVGSWATPVNANWTAIDGGSSATTTVALTSSNVTLTRSQSQVLRIQLTGTLTTNVSVSFPSTVAGTWIIDNQTSGSFSVTVNTSAGGSTGISAPQGAKSFVISDGTNVSFADSGVLSGAGYGSIPNTLAIYNTTITSSKLRWSDGLDGTSESGGNAGSNLIIQNYSDSGFLIGTVATFTRSSGAVNFANALSTSSTFAATGAITTGGLQVNPLADGFFRNLLIYVTGDSTLNVSADVFTAFDGTNVATFRGLSVTGATIVSAGSLNSLDTGGSGRNRWLQIWAVGNPSTGATGVMITQNAYPSPPSPLPTGYSMYAYAGAVKVDGSTNLYRSRQRGNRFRWVVTSSTNTAALPTITTGSVGSVTAPSWVASAVQGLSGANPSALCPPTAACITVLINVVGGGSSSMMAPNNNYGAYNSTSNPPPISTYVQNTAAINTSYDIELETTNIYVASNGSNTFSAGHIDNVNAS